MLSLGRPRPAPIGAIALLSALATAVACQSGIESVEVRDAGMAPGLVPGQQVLVQRLRAGGAEPGDVVVIRAPGAPEIRYIKRLIGRPGDVVLVSDGRAIAVPEGRYFALADNRVGSFDSHEGWFVSADDLVGRVMLSYWPPTAVGPVLPRGGPEALASGPATESVAERPS